VKAFRIFPKGLCILAAPLGRPCIQLNLDFAFTSDLIMTRKAKQPKSKPRKSKLLLAVVVAVAVLLILLRMLVFVAGHGHRGL
jgi:hypothetical protein